MSLQSVPIKIKRFDKSLPLPKYQTKKAAAVDLMARLSVSIPPGQVVKVPLNVAIQIPDDFFVLVSARSSLHKKGLTLSNGIGVGDADYCGDNDGYQAALLNFTKQTVEVEKGERLVQMMVLPRPKLKITEVDKMDQLDRGGFGSTGKN